MSVRYRMTMPRTQATTLTVAEQEAFYALHYAYRHHRVNIDFHDLVNSLEFDGDRECLGATLARHAVSRGHEVWMATWNIDLLAPSLFEEDDLEEALQDELELLVQEQHPGADGVAHHLSIVQGGVQLTMPDVTFELLAHLSRRYGVLLASVDADYLALGTQRDPGSAWVVIRGCDPLNREVILSDSADPRLGQPLYRETMTRLLPAITLSPEANLIALRPWKRADGSKAEPPTQREAHSDD